MRRAAFLALALASLASTAARADEPATVSFGRFGAVALVRPAGTPSEVVLFLSGDGGWNKGVVEMAGALAQRGALVLGIDSARYLKAVARSNEPCTYPAGELEGLSQSVQKQLGLPRYTVPVLVGYSSGATLAYTALVQAPANTFRGAISLGFCPDLPVSRPFCKGHGLVSHPARDGKWTAFEPAAEISAPWIALQGDADKVCDPKQTAEFVGRVPRAELVSLPKVGHGFGNDARWHPALLDAFAKLAATAPAPPTLAADVSDLPLVEVPAPGSPDPRLALIVSGDGGWASIDREVGGVLVQDGVAVVGLDSLQYFWKKRTPDGSADALARIARHYLGAWHKEKLVLVGYSRGADVLPFMASRLPDDLKQRVALVALLGPALSVEFEFHVADWLRESHSPATLPTGPELPKLRGLKLICVYGHGESESLCRTLDPALGEAIEVPGDHHFDGDYAGVARRILAAAGPP